LIALNGDVDPHPFSDRREGVDGGDPALADAEEVAAHGDVRDDRVERQVDVVRQP
jgi:hypothetical protein